MEDTAAARLGIETVGEPGLDAGGLVEEWERPLGRRELGGDARRVLVGLHLDPGERRALFLGLDDADGLSVRVEKVIGSPKAVPQRELAHGNPSRRAEVQGLIVLHRPAGGLERGVDLLACEFFGLAHGEEDSGEATQDHGGAPTILEKVRLPVLTNVGETQAAGIHWLNHAANPRLVDPGALTNVGATPGGSAP